MLRQLTKRKFGLFTGLKNIAKVPLKYTRNMWQQSIADDNPTKQFEEVFDEEAGEWRALIMENSYDLNIYQHWDQIIQPNFGTVDNPNLIFTSDVPYRFVACSGPPNEDDYEGHEMMYFMLREGPLQRCQCCGQVFKLIRLREEDTEQNHYYSNDFVRQKPEELGEPDHWIMLNAIRFMMLHSYEHTHFEAPSDALLSLKNADEHDRLLVDPAYRMEQNKLSHQKESVMNKSLLGIQAAIQEQHVKSPKVFDKPLYEDVVNAEIAIAELDQHFKAVTRFNMRSFLDKKNHERREKRMQERAEERTQDSTTIYLNGMTENEMKYRDYYESDEEALSMLGRNKYVQKTNVLSNPDYQSKKFDFQETYAKTVEPDNTSYVQKKVFKFNYRQAFVEEADHARKEERMLDRLKKSNFLKNVSEITARNAKLAAEKTLNTANEMEYYNELIHQAVENYKNYFESDLEDDFGYFESLPAQEKKEFVGTFFENGFLQSTDPLLGSVSIPRDHDPEKGLIERAIDNWDDIMFNAIPAYNQLNTINRNADILTKELFEKSSILGKKQLEQNNE